MRARPAPRAVVVPAGLTLAAEADEWDTPGPKSGLIDVDGRVVLETDPPREWLQMLRGACPPTPTARVRRGSRAAGAEAWRSMLHRFHSADMGGVDWEAVRRVYETLLPRVSCRSEFGDLVREMQTELGVSHTYESGACSRRRGLRPARA